MRGRRYSHLGVTLGANSWTKGFCVPVLDCPSCEAVSVTTVLAPEGEPSSPDLKPAGETA